MKTHKGGCHCGAVRYEVKGDFTKGMECNCSHCGKKGFLLTFAGPDDFTLLSGEDNLNEYRFNKKRIAHLFCKTCGVQSFGRGLDKQDNPRIAVNLRCIDDLDTATLEVTNIDGKSF